MIRNRNRLLKHLDDLMLLRWENEGGCLGPLTMTDRGSPRDDYSPAVSDAELDSTRSAIDSAMSDVAFIDQLTRQPCRADREVHWASAT
jgi:hypothetical protein